jgi:serine/threonine-protein kinase
MVRKCLSGLIAGAGLFLISSSVIPAWTQTPPAETFQPGPWQPVARVNPRQSISIKIINRTPIPIEYILTTQTGFRRLSPGQTAQLSNFSLPAYLNINPTRDRTAITYRVSVLEKTNAVTVEVYPAGSVGLHSINIDQTGAIYVY